MLLNGCLQLEQSNNLQKGETDYSHGGLRINSAYQCRRLHGCDSTVIDV